MHRIQAAFAAFAMLLSTQAAFAHQGHEIDRDLLASKIRERGHTCESVTEANEKKGEGPSVIAVKCSDGNAYQVVVTSTGFEVNAAATPPTPGTPDTTE
jgi:hypothetical protein